jgi:MFS transporter, DHA2 family, multidrug resistance protein
MSPLTGLPLVLLTIALSCSGFMTVLDVSIANVSIPYISGDLGVSNNQGTWVITCYAAGNAIALPITGWLTDRLGSARLMVLSTFFFTCLSWLCGLSFNYPMLLICRFLQGLVAGPLVPLGQTLLALNYPQEKRNMALSLFFMMIVVGPIVGPLLGGWITENYTWNWIFYINVPVGFLSAFIIFQILQGRESTLIKTPVDWIGLILLACAVSSLQVLLDRGEQLDWFRSSVITSLAIISALSFLFLILWEMTEKNPLFDLTLFKNRNFVIGITLVFLAYIVIFGRFVLLPLWLQTHMGYTSLWAGKTTAPFGVIPFLLGFLVGKWMDQVSLRLLAMCAFFCLGISSFFFTFLATTEISFFALSVLVFFLGAGIAFFLNPLVALSLQDVPKDRLSMANGILHFFRIFAQGAGASLCVYLWDRREIFHRARIVETLSGVILKTPQEAALLDTAASTQASMLAINDIFWITGWLSFVLMGASIFFRLKRTVRNPS